MRDFPVADSAPTAPDQRYDTTRPFIRNDGTVQYSATALAAFYNLSADIRKQIIQFYNETREFETKVGIIIPSIFTVVIIVGLVGNLLVIVVALNRQMRNSTNTLIIGLTCSDLMFLTLCVPFTAIDYAFPIWVLPTWSCNAINYLQHSSAYFSVWTLTLMAADRFLAVCYPVESMTLRSSKNTCIALFITYGIIMLSQIQVARIHDVYDYTFIIERRSACSIVSIAKAEATVAEARLYFFSFNLFGYVFPLTITCILYYFMLRRLWHMPKPGNHNNSVSESRGGGGGAGSMKTNISKLSSPSSSLRCRPETIRAKRKVTRLVMCVVVIWALCWLPLNICFFISGLIYPNTLVVEGGKPVIILQISSQVLAYTNSCLNPILYPLVSDNFRKGFLRVIGTILNWCSFGRLCKSNRPYRFNSRLEVTFYNNDGSRSRSSTNNHRMSRTNSCVSHRHNTSSTTNVHMFGELSSLLVRSSYSSRAGSAATTSMLATESISVVSAKRASAGHPKFIQRNSRTEISSVSLPLMLPSASVDSEAPTDEKNENLMPLSGIEAKAAMRRSITLTRRRQNRDTIDENEADEHNELNAGSSDEPNREATDQANESYCN